MQPREKAALPPDVWTAQRLEILRERHADGASAGEIARELGISRNAVCGKLFRLNQRAPDYPPIPFRRLKNQHCRAVLDGRGPDGLALFCGRPKAPGSSFCAGHHREFHAPDGRKLRSNGGPPMTHALRAAR